MGRGKSLCYGCLALVFDTVSKSLVPGSRLSSSLAVVKDRSPAQELYTVWGHNRCARKYRIVEHVDCILMEVDHLSKPLQCSIPLWGSAQTSPDPSSRVRVLGLGTRLLLLVLVQLA